MSPNDKNTLDTKKIINDIVPSPQHYRGSPFLKNIYFILFKKKIGDP
jgi:hypothetical protein